MISAWWIPGVLLLGYALGMGHATLMLRSILKDVDR